MIVFLLSIQWVKKNRSDCIFQHIFCICCGFKNIYAFAFCSPEWSLATCKYSPWHHDYLWVRRIRNTSPHFPYRLSPSPLCSCVSFLPSPLQINDLHPLYWHFLCSPSNTTLVRKSHPPNSVLDKNRVVTSFRCRSHSISFISDLQWSASCYCYISSH